MGYYAPNKDKKATTKVLWFLRSHADAADSTPEETSAVGPDSEMRRNCAVWGCELVGQIGMKYFPGVVTAYE